MKTKLTAISGIVVCLALLPVGDATPAQAQSQEDWEIVAQLPTVPLAWGVEVNNDGSLVYVTGNAGDVVAYDSTTFEVVVSTHLPVAGPGDTLGISVLTPDERYFITGDEHGDLYFLDPATLEILHRFKYGPQLGPNARIAVTSDSQWAITETDEPQGRQESIVRFYDLSGDTPQYVGNLVLVGAATRNIAVTPDDKQVYATNGARFDPPRRVFVIDIATRQLVTTIDTGDFSDIVMDPTRNVAYLGGLDGLGVVDIANASLQTIWPGDAYTRLSYDPVNDLLAAVVHLQSLVRFISPESGQIVSTTYLPASYPGYSAFSPDGERLYVPDYVASGGTLFVLERANQPPVADAGGPYAVGEGGTVGLVGSGSDPDSDPLTYAWDLDNDGEFETPDQNPTFSAVGRDGPDSQMVVLQVCDDSDECATDEATVEIQNVAPTITLVTNSGPIDEGSSVTVTVEATDPAGASDPLSYEFDCDNDGSFEVGPQPGNAATCGFEDNGSFPVNVRVTDDDGGETIGSTTVEVRNVAPSATFTNTSGTVDEGGSATLAFSDQFDPGTPDAAAGFLYSYDCTDDGTFELSDDPTASFVCNYPDNGTFTARGRIKDKDGGFTDYTVGVTVNNVPPTVGDIDAPADPVEVNTEISASAAFTDPGVLDTHTAEWDWGDGTISEGAVEEADGSGTVTGSHEYDTPGIYTVRLTVTDKDDGVGEAVFQYVVVYDPEGGFVTGGGWIDSLEGAYTADPSLTGRANFGFVSKYKKGTDVPTGVTEFQFQVADLNFHSDTYDWLVVAGAHAKFKGVGTINGEGEYKFMLTAFDADVNDDDSHEIDGFRIKIWWEEEDGTEHVVYDNQMGAADDGDETTEISGGSIVIHKKDK